MDKELQIARAYLSSSVIGKKQTPLKMTLGRSVGAEIRAICLDYYISVPAASTLMLLSKNEVSGSVDFDTGESVAQKEDILYGQYAHRTVETGSLYGQEYILLPGKITVVRAPYACMHNYNAVECGCMMTVYFNLVTLSNRDIERLMVKAHR